MADNTDKEHLDTPSNIQSENPSDEITSATSTKVITQNQETENMEIHNCHDLHHKKKKFQRIFSGIHYKVSCGR